MKLNNKGFTLVEMLVTIAILGMVSIAAMSLMSFSATTYSSMNTKSDLQIDMQITMAQISENTIDCNESIGFNNGILTITNKDNAHSYWMSEQILYYNDSVNAENGSIVAKNISEFNVKISSNSDGNATEIEVYITMEKNQRELTSSQIVGLRNKPKLS